jgi:hypothetical protein
MTGSMPPAPFSPKNANFRPISGHKWVSSLLLIAVLTYAHSQAAALSGHISITTTSLPPAGVQSPYNAVLSVSGGTSPYQFRVGQGALPPGLALNSSTGAITGTPTATGTYYFKVFVTDLPRTDDGDRRFNITVSGSNPSDSSITVTISPTGASVISGASQQFNASVSGTSQTAVNWSASAGTVSSSGLFTAPSVKAATTVTVTATSVAAPTQRASAAVSVNPITQPAGLAISTTALPPETSGLTYQANLYATGGTQPYQWSVISGALPAGFTLGSTGAISGTSSVIGVYNFTVQVQDSALQTASAALSLLVTTATSCGPPTYNCSRTDLIPAPNPAVPPQVGPNTCTVGSLNTCGNLTGANTIVTDPDFGNRIVRATDSTSGCGGTCTTNNSGAAGAQAWNQNSTMFVTGTTNGGALLFGFNPTTMQVTKLSGLPSNNGGFGYIWSWLNPNILYALNRTTIVKFDLTGYASGALPAPTTVFDFNSANCLQADPNWNANPVVTWKGQFQSSKDDVNFAAPLSNAGQQGTGFFTVVYTVGSGCRVLDSKSGTVFGQWGSTGAISIPDRWTVHANAISKSGAYDGVGYNNCLSTSCSGTSNGYFWQIATTTVTFPTGCVSGHESFGYDHWVNNAGCNHYGQDTIRALANPGLSSNLITNFPSAMVTPFDQHFSWQNVDVAETYPIISSTWTTVFPFPAAWYNEVIATFPTGSLGVPAGTVKRFAHTFITARSQRFITNQAIGQLSPDGRFYVVASDWLGTLGSESGSTTCTIGTNCRGDVFVVELK